MKQEQMMENNGNTTKECSQKRIVELIKEEVEKLCKSEARVELFCAEKNNGVMHQGMIIHEQGKGASPLIYLEPYVKEIEKGNTVKETAEAIYAVHQKYCGQEPAVAHELFDAKQIKDKVIYQLVNLEKNRSALLGMPYRVVGEDLAAVFSLLLENRVQGMMTARINHGHLEHWKMKEEKLWELANKNTPRLLPIELDSLDNIMIDLLKEQLKDSGLDLDEEMLNKLTDAYRKRINKEETPETQMFVLSNKYKLWGASTILYPGALKEAARQLRADLIILPSSVHEVILVRKNDRLRIEDMGEMVKSINQTEVLPEDVLSDSVYVYCAKEERFYRAACYSPSMMVK